MRLIKLTLIMCLLFLAVGCIKKDPSAICIDALERPLYGDTCVNLRAAGINLITSRGFKCESLDTPGAVQIFNDIIYTCGDRYGHYTYRVVDYGGQFLVYPE